jgi:DNA-binding Xre family transcriptional regulator
MEYERLREICETLNVSIKDLIEKMNKNYMKDLLDEIKSLL